VLAGRTAREPDQVVSQGRYVTFQMAAVAVSPQMYTEILLLIAQLRAPPLPARCARNQIGVTTKVL